MPIKHAVIFPRAFAFAIDDLGWNEGSDLSFHQPPGPYRTGVKRIFDLNDYKAIVDVAERVGARIQSLFILSEMDRENLLARFPTTTYQRGAWNNSSRVNDNQIRIMEYVRDQAAFMEFGFHGTGHEYWAPGQELKRAEWYNLNDKAPWPEESLREHIQCFKDIMRQYGLSPERGHSFPESFVPCAYSYYWNPEGRYSLGKLLSEVGVKYANTDFSQIPELKPPGDINGGGFDHGTHVINRLNYGNVWYALSKLPTVPLAEQHTDIIESHWPNWLAQDDFLQEEENSRWVNYYKDVQRSEERYIAKNTEQLHAQWLYKKYTRVEQHKAGEVLIDNSFMPNEPFNLNMLGNMVLKIRLDQHQHVGSATLNGISIPGYFEDEGFGFLYLPRLEQKRYTLEYSVNETEMPLCVYHDGTYNVYALEKSDKEIKVQLKVYGKQTIKIRCAVPESVHTSTPQLRIINDHYHHDTGYLHISIAASDFQGTKGEVIIRIS